MQFSTFSEMFSEATKSEATKFGPFPYQVAFAQASDLPHLVRAPTGAGKTATAILGWLWRHRFATEEQRAATPRRLVYCLPMRVLVEQTCAVASDWLRNLGLQDEIPVHVLMGGVDAAEWYLRPEKPAILIGTQDMLLSRALNRGYAASRFHWPIDFGLLNNDCLWVFDEPQLMANGVSTSAQLAGLRQALGTFGPCPSVWMSATLEPSWLHTIDFHGKFPRAQLELDEKDYDPKGSLYKRMMAQKTLSKLPIAATKEKDAAKAVWDRHHSVGMQTLVVLNTVERAKAVYTELEKLRKKSPTPNLLLIHSRFRPHERQQLHRQLQDKGAAADRIVVATQVVEAGVDISARTLVTELAPWASIVQRIGRCNRTGDEGPGQVFWIDLDEKLSPPYPTTALDFARTQLNKLESSSVSPKALDDYKRANEKPGEPFLPFEHKHVLRRRDLLDLFDTSPDLSGNDIDIQRFIRSDDPATDVQVFWRDMTVQGWDVSPQRGELCNVPIGSVRAFLKGKSQGMVWDHIDEAWRRIRDVDREIHPGLTIMLPTTMGGYSALGWDPGSDAAVIALLPLKKDRRKPEGVSSDPNSCLGKQYTLAAHTQHVCEELAELLKAIVHLPPDWSACLSKAARWHDVGKAHAAFQAGMRTANPLLDPNQLWAKSGTRGRLRHGRKYFRHELASALAALQLQMPVPVAYLIAAHHGRTRLAIRALPGEDQPANSQTLFALGVHDGDPLPTADLGDGQTWREQKLDLSPMRLGAESSWTARALKLLTDLGPFQLAYLEAILRAADERASQKEAANA